MLNHMDRHNTKPELQVLNIRGAGPRILCLPTIAKASALKNTFEEFKIDLLHDYVTKVFTFNYAAKLSCEEF